MAVFRLLGLSGGVTILILLLSFYFNPSKHKTLQGFSKLLAGFSLKLYNKIGLLIYIITISALGGAYIYAAFFSQDAGVIRSVIRIYGLTSLYLLFLVLTPGLLHVFFPNFPLNSLLKKARRSLGISAFIFAFCHGVLAFFFIYSGSMAMVMNLSVKLQLAFIFGGLALFIFLLLTLTSSDYMIRKMTFKNWKNLQRLIYIAVFLSILHTFIRGTDFQHRLDFTPQFVVFLSLTFVLLETSATTYEIALNETRSKALTFSYYAGLIFITSIGIFLAVSAVT